GYFRNEANWPVKAEEREFLLGGTGTLSVAQDTDKRGGHRLSVAPESDSVVYRADVGIAAGRYVIGQMLPGWGMPDDQRIDEPFCLVLTTEPFHEQEPCELLGPAAA